jgi:beta-glucosidase
MNETYKDASAAIEARVSDLMSRMTLQEKIGQMSVRNGSAESPAAAARANNETQRHAIDASRLGIPILLSRETSHGMNNSGVTSFPASIALASTWDEDLNYRVGRVIAAEAMAQGIRQGLSPVLDICRDPRWGRQEETYGEDPLLTGRLGSAFIKGLQGGDLKDGIVATPKHLVGYSASEGGKDNDPITISPRDLHEVYLPPFEMAFKDAKAQSVMICFGAVNGIPCTSDKRIVTDLLAQWGFDGFVIDDCPGIAGLVGHRAASDMKEAIGLAINAGIDRQFWDYCGVLPSWEEGQNEFEKHLLALVKEGKVPPLRIDDAAKRVLLAKFKLGLFEKPYCDPEVAATVASNPAHKQLAREAAVKGIVLLKNDAALGSRHPLLPLDATKLKRIAVIGPNAAEGQLGDYSGSPEHVVSPLEGIRAAAGNVEVLYEKGCEILSAAMVIQRFSVRLSGSLKVDVEDDYMLAIESNDGARLTINGQRLIDDWSTGPRRQRMAKARLTRGSHPIVLEYSRGTKLLITEGDEAAANHNILRLLWSRGGGLPFAVIPDDNLTITTKRSIQAEGSGEGLTMEVFFGANFEQAQPEQTRVVKDVDFNWGEKSPILATKAEDHEHETIQRAVDAAKRSDVAILFVGETSSRKGAQQVCGEHFDRADISLTGSQERLVLAVAATGTPTVVVLINGRSLAIPNIAKNVTALLEAWYPGQEGGHAIADILFGKANPSGKLPAAIPHSTGQLPVYYSRRPRMGWYIDEKSDPLFPFGFGLSYTRFAYGAVKVSPERGSGNAAFTASVEVTNSGAVAGEEVVQLYIEDAICTFLTPAKWLRDFKRVALRPGEKQTVTFAIPRKSLESLDADFKPRLESGEFKIQVGGSSAGGPTASLWVTE